MRYDLPVSLKLEGTQYPIRADFRTALDIFGILNDPELNQRERVSLALLFFYPDYPTMPPTLWQAAIEGCFRFLAGGQEPRPGPVLMDWEQDFPYIIAPVNRVVGREIRAEPFFHWWSFLSAYGEIGECVFTRAVAIRSRRAAGKPLDKEEAAWYRANRDIVELRPRLSTGERELLKTWGGTM